MRKSIVVLIVAVLAVAAGAVVLSLSAPVLDEEVEYRLTSLYYRGQEISSQVDGDEAPSSRSSTSSPSTGDRRSRPRWTGTRCWICWRAPPAV